MSVICFGEVLIDFLSDGKIPESFTKYAGGAPANVAVAISKLQGESFFCGMVGNDMFGHFLLEQLQCYGVNTQWVKVTSVAKTALAFVSLDEQGERSFSFYRPPAADLLFRNTDFNPELFKQAKVFHLCSNSLTEKSIYHASLAGVKMAKNAGLTISFDINLRLNLWPSTRYTAERIWHIIGNADIVKFAQEELEFLCNNSNKPSTLEQTIARCFEQGVKLVIVTNGAKPISVYTDNQMSEVAIIPVPASDTTAAGDSFIAGVLFDLVKREIAIDGAQLNDYLPSIAFGAQCAAITVTRFGSFTALPTAQDLN